MRRIATVSALAALLMGMPILEATTADACCRGRRTHRSYAPLERHWGPFEAWRAYYGAQAEVSWARRAGRAYYYAETGRALPSRVFGPPTNAYAESYALNPYSYFMCPEARRGDGMCTDDNFFHR